MKTSKEEFVETFENYIETLITKQAQMVIEINDLRLALEKHHKEECRFNLTYEFDEETGVYSYKKTKDRKIGF